MYCSLNGALAPLATATIPVSDRGFLYGETLFETMRAVSLAIPLWDAHMARLRASADRLGFLVPYANEELLAQCLRVVEANALPAAVVRLTLTRGAAAAPPALLVTAQAPSPEFARKATDGYRIASSAWERPSHRAWPLYAKTGNYLNSVLALRGVGDQCDEAIQFDDEGFLTEGSFSNIFIVREQALWTPALPRCLPGVGRALVIACAREAGLDVLEKDIPRAGLERADELFLSNAVRGIMPVRVFDGAVLPWPGAVTAALAARWAARAGWSEWPA